MDRRQFLKTSAVTSAALSVPITGFHVSGVQAERIFAPGKNPVLVSIYLRGGQDQLNTIVPYTDDRYYEIRPSIAIAQENVIPLDDQWGIHPAMAPLKPFYDRGKFAVVINSGSPHPTRSHFDAQDFMEFAAPGNRTLRNGWLNRFLEATKVQQYQRYGLSELRAIAMQDLLPRSLRGSYPVIAAPDNLEQIQEVLDLFENFYSDSVKPDIGAAFGDAPKAPMGAPTGVNSDPVMQSGQETIRGLRRLRELVYGEEGNGWAKSSKSEDETPIPNYPPGRFALRMEGLARVIKAGVGLEVAASDINGWDHHIGMGSDDGALDRMLAPLAETLAAFMIDLGSHLDRTLILVTTEFGRVCQENGNDGADHGHGGSMWLLGGGVQGGKIHGRWTGLAPEVLYEKRDLPVTTDFRHIFHEVLTKHMRYEPAPNFFPGYKVPKQDLRLFQG